MTANTFTFTENQATSYESKWVLETYMQDQQVSGDTVTITPLTCKAKYTYSGKSKALVCANYNIKVNGASRGYYFYTRADRSGNFLIPTATSSGTMYTISLEEGSISFPTGDIFNSTNASSPYVEAKAILLDTSVFESERSDGTWHNGYNLAGGDTELTSAKITLNAPPTFNVSALGKNTDNYYVQDTVVSVTVSGVDVKYGGNLSSVVFKIGDQVTGAPSATTFYIRLDTAGTFTPTVTVKDSRGQTTTTSLPSITVGYQKPSCTPHVQSGAPYIKNYSGNPYVVRVLSSDATIHGGGSL